MKKSSIFSVLVLLAALLMFAGCDGLGETTTYVTVEAEDGFTLEESNISFNASTSVSSSSTVDDDDAVYVPVELDELEDGDEPTIYFTFSEDLRSIFNFGGTDDEYSADSLEDHIFEINGSEISVESYVVSGDTVTFTFDVDTFDADDEVYVYFGVVSDAGEYYYVQTYFQPQVDITETTAIADDFDDYYAYAIDSDKVFVLIDGIDDDCVVATEAESIYGATNIPEDADFGKYIIELSTRASQTDDTYLNYYDSATNTYYMYQDLQHMEDSGTTLTYIPLTIDTVEYANGYYVYDCDEDGNATLISTITDASYDIDYDLYEDFSYNFSIDTNTIEDGDYVYVVPFNTRGEFEDCAASYELVDTIQPYAYTGDEDLTADMYVDTIVTSTLTDAGEDYSTHDERDDSSWGHLSYFDSFSVMTPDGSTSWAANEGIEISFDSVSSLTAALKTATDEWPTSTLSDGSTFTGAFKYFTDYDDAIESLEDDCNVDVDAYDTILSNGSGNVWCLFDGATVYVYLGFICNDGENGIDYSTADFQVYGNFNFTITDASGNELMFRDQADYEATDYDSSSDDVSNGSMTITLEEI